MHCTSPHSLCGKADALAATSIAEESLFDGFAKWMVEHRGAKPSTVHAYRAPLRRFIVSFGANPQRLDAVGLRAFICQQAGIHGHSAARRVVTACRMFLRYLSGLQLCSAALADAVPAVAGWRLASTPRYLLPAQVDQVLARCDCSTADGLRDRAIVLLASRLGLRAQDIAELALEDLDFEAATLSVAGKNRRQCLLPLPQDVGDALIAYLEHARPNSSSRRVFVRKKPPHDGLNSSVDISRCVKRALLRAGIVRSPSGAHLLRHSAAFRLLLEGATLEGIGTLLRHASLDTTAIYAKVDLTALSQIAQPWPTEVAC